MYAIKQEIKLIDVGLPIITVKLIIDKLTSRQLIDYVLKIKRVGLINNRYFNYCCEEQVYSEEPQNNLVFIEPEWDSISSVDKWADSCLQSEKTFFDLITKKGVSINEAKIVLNDSLKVDMFLTMNYNSWIYLFSTLDFYSVENKVENLLFNIIDLFNENNLLEKGVEEGEVH